MAALRKTKIVCTLGPATEDDAVLREMILSGMNVVRLNFSHGSYEGHARNIRRVRALSQELHTPIGIMLDTKGPEIRLKTFREHRVTLHKGQFFTLCTDEVEGDNERVSITYANLPADVQPGTTILIDDGLVGLTVESVSQKEICCRVNNDGVVSDRKGINVPDANLSMPFISQKDRDDILFGIQQDVDFIAASFTRTEEDILSIRKLLNDNGGKGISIIAKIENMQGVQNIDSILAVSDGVMVARGDLGVEIPLEQIPIIQKMIIRKCNLACKVVITATQMLDSMIRNPRPTRAEVSDVANAVYEGTDAVMLSGETAMGSYPIEAVRMMSQIAEESEKYLDYMFYQRRKVSAENLRNISNTVCYSSVATASDLEAPVIVAPSVSGFTTRMLSKWRPKALIAGLSPSMTAVRQMQLYWGVKPFHAKRAESTDALLFASVELLKEKGIVKEGEIVVATAGVVTRANRHEPVADTNIMRVMVVE